MRKIVVVASAMAMPILAAAQPVSQVVHLQSIWSNPYVTALFAIATGFRG